MSENSYISKVILPSSASSTNPNIYYLKDEEARSSIASALTSIAGIQSSITNGLAFLGRTTTDITPNTSTNPITYSTANPITINSESVSALAGSLVLYGDKEFLFDGTYWQELGDLTALGALSNKDSASGSYTPTGSVSAPTFTGSSSQVNFTIADNSSGNYQPAGTISSISFTGASSTFTGTFTPSGSVTVTTNQTTNKTATVSSTTGTATYTPSGSVTNPTISVSTAGSTASVNSITSVGALSSFSATVTNEILTLAWNSGTLPSYSATTVKTGDASYSATGASFSGTGVRLVTGNIAVPSSYTASFSGSTGDISVVGTPGGSVSTPNFTGTKVKIDGVVTPSGSISQPAFTGDSATITVS